MTATRSHLNCTSKRFVHGTKRLSQLTTCCSKGMLLSQILYWDEHLCRNIPANMLFTLRRLHSLAFSFPPLESKLSGGKCLIYIGTEGTVGKKRTPGGHPTGSKRVFLLLLHLGNRPLNKVGFPPDAKSLSAIQGHLPSRCGIAT